MFLPGYEAGRKRSPVYFFVYAAIHALVPKSYERMTGYENPIQDFMMILTRKKHQASITLHAAFWHVHRVLSGTMNKNALLSGGSRDDPSYISARQDRKKLLKGMILHEENQT